MSVKKARKVGFFVALSIMVGSVIGIGIFIRNLGVSTINNGNGTGILLSWIFGAIIALFAAISYSEIGLMKVGKLSGLSAWANRTGGSKYGYVVRTIYSFFYFPVTLLAVALFAEQFLLAFVFNVAFAAGNPNASMFASNNVPMWIQILIAIGILIFLNLMHYLSQRAASLYQVATTVLKFIPLVLVIVIGVSLVNRNFITAGNADEIFLAQPGQNAFQVGSPQAAGIFLALPGVLFTFDSFLNVATISKRMKNGEKDYSKIVIFGMILIAVVYLLVTLSSILNNQGALQNVLINTLGVNAALPILIFFNLFIFFSATGVANGLTFAWIGEMGASCNSDLWFGAPTIREKYSASVTNRIYMTAIYFFWGLIIFIPSITLNTDKLVDMFSTMPTVIFFVIYPVTTLLYLRKRNIYAAEIDTNKKYWVIATAIIIFSIGSGIGVFGYYINVIVQAITDPLGNSGLGLFGPTNIIETINNRNLAIGVYLINLFVLSTPLINLGLIRLFDKKTNPFVLPNDFKVAMQEAAPLEVKAKA